MSLKIFSCHDLMLCYWFCNVFKLDKLFLMYVFISLTILSHIAQKLNEVDACLVVPRKFVFTYFCQLSRIDFLSRISLRCTFQKKKKNEKQRIKMTINVEGILQRKKMCSGITHLNRSYVRILCGTQCETLFFFTFFICLSEIFFSSFLSNS